MIGSSPAPYSPEQIHALLMFHSYIYTTMSILYGCLHMLYYTFCLCNVPHPSLNRKRSYFTTSSFPCVTRKHGYSEMKKINASLLILLIQTVLAIINLREPLIAGASECAMYALHSNLSTLSLISSRYTT